MKQVIFSLLCILAAVIELAGQTALSFTAVQQTLDRLPLLPENQVWAGQFSSHSKHQHNMDIGEFLYRDDKGDAVIFEVEGPGRITSLWGTVFDSSSILKFYVDGAKQPQYVINVIDLFNGKDMHFPSPLVTYDRRGYYIEGAYAGNSFVPVYFNRSLKISVQGKPTFYHILYEKRPFGTIWSDSLKDAQRNYLHTVLSNSGKPLAIPPVGAPTYSQKMSLAPYGGADILKHAGEGVVRYLTIEVDSSFEFLRNVYIQMIWDDESLQGNKTQHGLAYEKGAGSRLHHVMSPVGIFFASPHFVTEVYAAPVELQLVQNGRMKLICRLPMPFWRNARITLANRSGTAFSVDAAVIVDSTAYPESKTGYFTTCYRKGLTEYGRDWLFCETQGTGWFLGVVQSSRLEHYCEGNEHFYIDGNRTPQINGTGTEDYYLACLWPNMRYNTPFAGCVNDVRIQTGGDPKKYYDVFREDYLVPAVYYRFHLDMPIPFYSSIDARIQHGAESQIRSEYESLAYMYVKNTPVLRQTDFIAVGNAGSLAAHAYRSKGKNHTLTARYEGNYLYTSIADAGKRHTNGDEITFNVAVSKTNAGVRLRRRTDQSEGRQTATVYVNGQLAGTWSDPQSNNILQWFDSEFDIPASLTRNRDSLKIKLVVKGRHTFNDFEYQILSYE
jgi:hypothetical protein